MKLLQLNEHHFDAAAVIEQQIIGIARN